MPLRRCSLYDAPDFRCSNHTPSLGVPSICSLFLLSVQLNDTLNLAVPDPVFPYVPSPTSLQRLQCLGIRSPHPTCQNGILLHLRPHVLPVPVVSLEKLLKVFLHLGHAYVGSRKTIFHLLTHRSGNGDHSNQGTVGSPPTPAILYDLSEL